MNYFVIAKLLGLLLMTFGASMAPSILWSLYFAEAAWRPLGGALLITMAAGAALYLIGRAWPQEIFRREATATVGLGWVLSGVSGALPYYLAGLSGMPTFADCFFESMSGLTTTGSSVLTDIEAVPRGLLFWRSWTHFLGGLGIIMLFVAVLPYLGAGGRALVKSEITGPVKDGLTPRIKDTALLLSRLYIGLTIVQTCLLMLAGMGLFDALCHSFGTLATGGFSTKNASLAYFYDRGAIEVIVLAFMTVAGMNFALIYGVFSGKWGAVWRDVEWRVYLAVIVVSSFLIAGVLLAVGQHEAADTALRDALFTVVSVMTTTGFVTADFERWPAFVQGLLTVLMFIGGCAGSTGGGLKVVRLVILMKIAARMIERVYRPRSVRQIRLGGTMIAEDIQEATLGLFLLWVLAFAAGGLGVALFEVGHTDLVTPFTASATALNNVGPGFSMVGATQNFAFLTPASKWLLSLLMLLGRLELYAVLVLFAPHFWRRQ